MIDLHEWTKAQVPVLERRASICDDVLGYALARAAPVGLWLEFGVAGGASLRRIAATARAASPSQHAPRVVGFDSFEGLPEEWRWNYALHVPKGHFRQAAPPVVEGAELVIGLFQDTIRPWLQALDAPRVTLVHVDCDLYSASLCVLDELAYLLEPGTLIVFDELVGFPGFDVHEWRALHEASRAGERFAFDWIARSAGQQVAIRIEERGR